MEAELKSLKIDRTKLKTIKNYALLKGVTVTTVHNWIKAGNVNTEDIDGCTFVKLS